MKEQGRNLKRKMANLLDIPHDVVLDFPKITIIGNIQLYIENHRGIIEYRSDSVRILVSFGELEINGEKLTIRSITRDEIHLDGAIGMIRFSP